MIKKEGSKYVLRSKTTGKVLGTHKSKKDAQAQEVAILINKVKKKK